MVLWLGPQARRFNPIVVKSIILANVVVFIIELIFPNLIIDYFALWPNAILHGEKLWGLVTHMFLHSGFLHIFFNMYALYIFGPECEKAFGRGGFLALYFFSGLIGALMHIALCPVKDVPALGASGAIFGLMGAYAVLYPKRRIAMFFFVIFVVLPAWKMIIFLMALFTFFALVGILPTVSHYAHIGGIIGGIIFAWLYLRQHVRMYEEPVILMAYRAEYRYEGYEDEDYDYEYY